MPAPVSNPMKGWVIWGGALTVALGLMIIIFERAPPHTFDPFCTYDLTYRLNVVIEADGRQYSSKAVRQIVRERRWVRGLFYNSCTPANGSTVSFRLADNRLVLIGSGICQKAELALADRNAYFVAPEFADAMREHRKVDLISFCAGVRRDKPPAFKLVGYDGFILDNADSPKQWTGFEFDSTSSCSEQHLRIVEAVAEAADISPEDELENLAPAVLYTNFQHDSRSLGPETILYSRGYYPFMHTAKQHQG